jgi:hypothetical protein
MLNERTLHESARAVAIEAASRIVADTEVDKYGHSDIYRRDKSRTQATVTMAQEFYRFIVHGDTDVS